MKAETWPYRVRVRVYRHFKQRREESSQFNQRENPAGRDVRQTESSQTDGVRQFPATEDAGHGMDNTGQNIEHQD